MDSLIVIKLKIATNPHNCIINLFIVLQVDLFIFHGSPKSFNKDVVKDSSSTIHTDFDVWVTPQNFQIIFSCKLTSFIRIVNIRNIDLNLLIALDVLLDERNVTRAAERLSYSQPAVSGMLKRLRAIFGVWTFYSIIHVWNEHSPSASILDRVDFVLSLVGL